MGVSAIPSRMILAIASSESPWVHTLSISELPWPPSIFCRGMRAALQIEVFDLAGADAVLGGEGQGSEGDEEGYCEWLHSGMEVLADCALDWVR